MNSWLARFTSRKFILALVANITAIIVLLYPDKEDTITQVSQTVGALLAMILTSGMFIHAEGRVDAVRAQAQGDATVAAMDKVTPAVAKEVVESAPPITNTTKE